MVYDQDNQTLIKYYPMKHLLCIAMMASVTLLHSQAFTGKGDNKFQIGLNVQGNATGMTATYDFGAGEKISFGIVDSYALGVDDAIDADFGDRVDVRA